MCNNCYHSNGRNKKAWKCSHLQKPHYALGVCQTCYQSKYTTKIKNALEDNIVNTHSSLNSEEDSEINHLVEEMKKEVCTEAINEKNIKIETENIEK